ncbi:MAG TPA: CARDB domain-containing protein [Gemmatimonadales bacterium]|nr:CARDB domain-containing protein [Gemmatimonadales bacterium]
MLRRTWSRLAVILALTSSATLWYACSESSLAPSSRGNAPRPLLDLRAALAAQRQHTNTLLRVPGVIGTAVTSLPDGRAGVLLLLERSGIVGLPEMLDGVPVRRLVTGRLMAFSDPTKRQRPAPMGFSVGHPAITAGTIGARARDALGRVYILSNNHVLANSNNATIGDPEYQPGPYDGGTAADQIATLSDFQQISFAAAGANTIDAAIALSSTDLLDNSVPADEGYGMPNSAIYDDADGNGAFDDRDALLGLNVQKYGRTTHLTHGQITGVNATVTICYAVSGFTCTKTARYVDQLIISPNTFSGGGDSGSLIVTDDANLNPVALLFAGSSSITIGNRIDLVLNRFGVTIDGFAPPPPGPLTDVGVMGINAAGGIIQNTTTNLTVTVKNFGNQDVTAFAVTLADTTDHVTLGTQNVTGLAAGSAVTLSFAWTPLSSGDHGLVANQTLTDDRPINDQRGAIITVAPQVRDAAVTSIGVAGATIQGHVVSASVTVANVGNQSLTTPFDVTLDDSTAGVTLGTQTVGGLAIGATSTVNYSWDLTSAALGTHTLVATMTLTDDRADNNRRAVGVTVNPKPLDVAVTGITGPSRVTVGDTAHVVVSLQNVGELDVGSSFAVTLTDQGVPVASGTAPPLAIGATTSVDIPWNTAGATTSGHILIATSQLADAVSSNNAVGIGITVMPPPDIAVTSVSAPTDVTVGNAAPVVVTVQNIGGQHVGGFNVVLRDATSGVTIGTQAIPGLAMTYSTTATFNWNTGGAALGSHTLVATQTLPDGNHANDQGTATVNVNPLSTDVAVTAVSVPATVTRGSTPTVGVTIQNSGGQSVSNSFGLTLTDATAGVTIGTQTIAGLAGNASATRSFNWSTTNATLGSHTLVASIDLSDQSAANNQRSVTVTVATSPPDVALANLVATTPVTVGDTVPIVVTVQNVGGQDVTTSFDVLVTDGGVGAPTVGTLTFPGLAAGSSSSATISWATAGLAIGVHNLLATQKYADNNTSNNSRAAGVTISSPSVHVGNLDGVATVTSDSWSAAVTITAHDAKHRPLPGVTVTGNWFTTTSVNAQCVTNDTGTCTLSLAALPLTLRAVSYSVSGMTLTGFAYKMASNHDPDGSSNGYSIAVRH